MPVVAVVAAAFAVEGAVAAAAAAGGFFATGAATFATITAIGAVTAAVGAVTGNEKLMKIGAVIGIAGSIGGFASGAGFFGEGGAFGTAPSEVAAGVGATAQSANTPGISGADVVAADNPAGMVADASGAAPAAAPVVDAPAVTAPAVQKPIDPTAATSEVAAATPPVGQTTTPPQQTAAQGMVDSAAGVTPPTAAATPPMASMAGPSTGQGLAPAGAFDQLSGMFKGLGKFVNDNKGLSEMLLKGVMSATADTSLQDAQTAKLRQDVKNAGVMPGQINTAGLANFTRPSAAAGMITQASQRRI